MIIDLKGPDPILEKEALALQHSTHDLTIADDEEYGACATLLTEIRGEVKSLTAQRDSVVKPINEGLKKLRALYKPALDSLGAAEQGIKTAMLTFRSEQERLRSEAEAAAHEALAEGLHDLAMVHIHDAAQEAPKATGVSARKVWKLRVIDLARVPREFMVVDTAALRRHAISNGWDTPPAGIEYYQEEGLMIR